MSTTRVSLQGDRGYVTFNSIKAITIELQRKVREDFTVTEKGTDGNMFGHLLSIVLIVSYV